MMRSGASDDDVRNVDELESKVERVLGAVRGLREDEGALVLGIAAYAVAWRAANLHGADDADDTAVALLLHAAQSGRDYAQALIAEGSIWFRPLDQERRVP